MANLSKDQLAKAYYLYGVVGLTQAEIASQLGLQQREISNALSATKLTQKGSNNFAGEYTSGNNRGKKWHIQVHGKSKNISESDVREYIYNMRTGETIEEYFSRVDRTPSTPSRTPRPRPRPTPRPRPRPTPTYSTRSNYPRSTPTLHISPKAVIAGIIIAAIGLKSFDIMDHISIKNSTSKYIDVSNENTLKEELLDQGKEALKDRGKDLLDNLLSGGIMGDIRKSGITLKSYFSNEYDVELFYKDGFDYFGNNRLGKPDGVNLKFSPRGSYYVVGNYYKGKLTGDIMMYDGLETTIGSLSKNHEIEGYSISINSNNIIELVNYENSAKAGYGLVITDSSLTIQDFNTSVITATYNSESDIWEDGTGNEIDISNILPNISIEGNDISYTDDNKQIHIDTNTDIPSITYNSACTITKENNNITYQRGSTKVNFTDRVTITDGNQQASVNFNPYN